jgi:hypothetical protein
MRPEPTLHGTLQALPIKLAVINEAGEHLFWADEDLARQLRKSGKVDYLYGKNARRNRVVALRATAAMPRLLKSTPGKLSNTRFVHNHDSDTNIQGVWEFLPVQFRPLFVAA